MRFYPAYKIEDVLNEPVIRFYAFLNEGYRKEAEDKLFAIDTAELSKPAKQIDPAYRQNLEWAATDTDDILDPDGEGSSPADIKKLLQG